jgi:hypothetical protein
MIQKVSGRAAALAEAAKVLELFPERAEAYSMVVRLLLLEGVWQEAEAHLGRAAGAGVRSPELDQLETIVGKASHGPRWQKRFTHASRYYVVHSDIDEKTCREAGAILDEAYYYYSYRLKRVSDIENARFQVYVFSSTEAYKKYAENIGSRGEGSLGMYSSLLKQLLISSHLSAEQLARTIRHEGFHQYLDRVVESPPRWFNEGLAEYYEAAVTTAGRWEMGRVADVHLAQLRAKGLVPLRILFSESVGEFMANAQQRYAQSWAVIHFLRHSSREREELFEGILQSLIAHPDPEVALEKALGGLAPEILDIDLRRHVNGLIRGR